MASAAAVAANEARSPLGNDIGDGEGAEGEITSGIYPKEDGIPGVDADEDDDEDDELPSNPMRGRRSGRPANGGVEDEQEDGDDLFGDEDGEEPAKPARRQLDDAELDSGDDEDRNDRTAEEPEPEEFRQEKVVMDLELPRQPVPEPSDGEMYLLKVPSFMAIEPQAWDHKTFQPPTTDHHSTEQPSQTFSAYNTALTTMRWRHSPSNPSKLQSNARINRWADGSLTLQLASDPTTHYDMDSAPMAPPQRNPLKPTPTSVQKGQRGGRRGAEAQEKYDASKDSYTYLIRPHPDTSSMIVTHKFTTGLQIKASAGLEDAAIASLQASLAAAQNSGKVNGANGINMVQVDEDPEAAKAAALAAVKEQEKRDKRAAAARDREAMRADRALGARGLGSNRYSGLNVGMLEDDEEGGGGRSRSSPNKSRKPRRRRNSEYSEDEDFGRRRFGAKEDEYDEEDDFVARSDEEEEVVDDDDDEDDGIVERERTPKRDREADDEEADAPGEEEEEEEEDSVQMARTKRRRVIDDEDEE